MIFQYYVTQTSSTAYLTITAVAKWRSMATFAVRSRQTSLAGKNNSCPWCRSQSQTDRHPRLHRHVRTWDAAASDEHGKKKNPDSEQWFHGTSDKAPFGNRKYAGAAGPSTHARERILIALPFSLSKIIRE
jgi:hypothetical protein